jgi:hypothetical protein
MSNYGRPQGLPQMQQFNPNEPPVHPSRAGFHAQGQQQQQHGAQYGGRKW